jgi:hypothetical protein
MNPLSGYLIDGSLLVDSRPFSRNRSRKQAFQEIIDRLEQDQIQPILCREPLARFSPGQHPLEDEHSEYYPEKVFCDIEGQHGQMTLCSGEGESQKE